MQVLIFWADGPIEARENIDEAEIHRVVAKSSSGGKAAKAVPVEQLTTGFGALHHCPRRSTPNPNTPFRVGRELEGTVVAVVSSPDWAIEGDRILRRGKA